MPKRKAKRCVKPIEEDKNKDEKSDKGTQREEKKDDFVDEEVERQIGAIRATRDVEVEHTLTALRLLRSIFNEEQLNTPVLDFFKDNLPSLSITTSEESGEIELKWNEKNCDTSMGNEDNGMDSNYSILKGLSMGFPHLYTRQSLGGYDLPDNVKASLLGTDNTHLENIFCQSENGMLASHDALRTPQMNGQRLSFGMTPKTRRQPKKGEMMLSVHGSPLGLYNEDPNMEAINEENS